MSEEKLRLRLKACPWCGWRAQTLWTYFDGRIAPKKKSPTEYSIHCDHCGYASKKSRSKKLTAWYWNHRNNPFKKGKRRYHIYGEEF